MPRYNPYQRGRGLGRGQRGFEWLYFNDDLHKIQVFVSLMVKSEEYEYET
jgi:hypothetical protein